LANNDLDPSGSPETDNTAECFQKTLEAKLQAILRSVRVPVDTDGQELVRALVEDAYRETLHPELTVETLPMSEEDRTEQVWRFEVKWSAPIAIWFDVGFEE